MLTLLCFRKHIRYWRCREERTSTPNTLQASGKVSKSDESEEKQAGGGVAEKMTFVFVAYINEEESTCKGVEV